jgi:hypothetical protein
MSGPTVEERDGDTSLGLCLERRRSMEETELDRARDF